MDKLTALAAFVRVAETRSFTAAAQRLGMTASGVSRAIARLEERLGVRLVNRTTRSVSLTDDGTGFLDRCRQILAEMDDAEGALTRASLSPRGRLRIQAPPGFGRRILLPALAEFLARHPDLTVDMELSHRVVDLAEESIDAAVGIDPLGDSRMIARKLCDTTFVACASPEYLSRHGEPRTPADLAQHRCLNYVFPHTGRYREWEFEEAGARAARAPPGRLNINDVEALLEAAVAGLGIIHLSTFLAAEAVQSGRLRLVLREYATLGPTLSVVYLQSRHLSPRVRAFVDFLGEIVPPRPAWDRILEPAATAERRS